MTIIEKMDALIEKLESNDENFIKSFNDDFDKFTKNKSERKINESKI